MYIFKTSTKGDFWIEKEEELVSIIADIDKILEIEGEATQSGRVMPIFVGDGVRDRDCGYMDFDSDYYKYSEWSDKLLKDYREQQEKIENTWFNHISIGEIDIPVVTQCGPVFFQIERFEIKMTLDFSRHYEEEERTLLKMMSEAFEYVGQNQI